MSSSPLRALRDSDADAVAALFVEAFGDARPLDAEEIRTWLQNELIRPEWMRVLEQEGRIGGYGDIWIQDGEAVLDVAAPGCWDAFYDWAEQQARVASASVIRTSFPAGHELERIVSRRGYAPARSSFTMEAVLDEPIVPEPPAGIELRPYGDGDDAVVCSLINDTFAGSPGHHAVTAAKFREFYLGSRGADPSLWTLAWAADEPAGYVLAYPEHVGEPGLGWIGTLGVRAPWRRRGLGGTLLRHAFVGLYARGLRRVGLGVDVENETGAVRLYERAGMQVVRRFDNWARTP
ncbi:MAG TPA: GNAT family N-acetyltransferase [Gaiellaceae bacterium]|nr:GNAT family N-acetyltransferase [Gaiellaceae bacterium]